MVRRQNPRRNALFVAAGLGFVGYKLLQRWRQANIKGQVVLITGGSRGLGLALARAFAYEGCRLVLCARDAQELDWAREDLAGRGTAVLPLQCDVADQEQVNHAVEEATRHFGRVDILVNNAGQIQVGPMTTATVKDFEDALGVMFWGALYPTLAVLPQMRARGRGRIVNITSIGGKVGIPHLLPYTCAKFATVGLSQGLRAELGREGISITTIVPGLMRTGSHLNAMFRGQHEQEFTWFSLGASLPLVSMDAEQAARQIVRATQRGEAERILSLPANLLERFHGLFPGTTSNLLHVVNRLLPVANGTTPAGAIRGETIQQRQQSGLFNVLTSQGQGAAERFHQYRKSTRRGP